MRRAIITGIGIVSCIGNDKATVLESLRNSNSGISFSEEFAEMGFRSQVYGRTDIVVTLSPFHISEATRPY